MPDLSLSSRDPLAFLRPQGQKTLMRVMHAAGCSIRNFYREKVMGTFSAAWLGFELPYV